MQVEDVVVKKFTFAISSTSLCVDSYCKECAVELEPAMVNPPVKCNCIVKTHSVDLYDRSVHTGSTCIILQRNRKCSEVSFSKLSHKMSLICDCNCHTLASIHSWQFHRRSPTTVKAVLTDTLMGAVISPLNI